MGALWDQGERIEATFMIERSPPLRMWRATRHERAYDAIKLPSITRANASTGVRSAGSGGAHASIVDEAVDASVLPHHGRPWFLRLGDDRGARA